MFWQRRLAQHPSQSVSLHASRRPLRGAGAERNSNLPLVVQELDFKHCSSLLCKINKGITCMLPISGMLGICRPIFPSHDPSKSLLAHTSASWKPFQSAPDPGSGWQTCNVRSEFPILTKTCLRPTLQVKSFTEIKDASVPAVQNLMPRHVPVQSRRGTQQSTQQSSPFHIEFAKLMWVNLPMPCPKTGNRCDNGLEIFDA